MGPAKCEQYLKAEVPGLIEFASSIGADSEPDSDVSKAAVNMLGDVCSVMQVCVVPVCELLFAPLVCAPLVFK